MTHLTLVRQHIEIHQDFHTERFSEMDRVCVEVLFIQNNLFNYGEKRH